MGTNCSERELFLREETPRGVSSGEEYSLNGKSSYLAVTRDGVSGHLLYKVHFFPLDGFSPEV